MPSLNLKEASYKFLARPGCSPSHKSSRLKPLERPLIRAHSPMQRIAVLYQALEPPVFNGVQKPRKPGGYQDSGADIAWVLKNGCNVPVLSPKKSADSKIDRGWCFPDDEAGILAAMKAGATCLWANTVLFASHPLQTSTALNEYEDVMLVIGQPPALVEAFDDKAIVYEILKAAKDFTLAPSVTASSDGDVAGIVSKADIQYPVIAKPVRGRGSHGVKLCQNEEELRAHAKFLFKEAPKIIIEKYMSGEEATVTIMPPSTLKPHYWALPIVRRFNHEDGIAPYNGIVAVTKNSRVVTSEEQATDSTYERAARECERVAALLKVTAPIRVDIRRFDEGSAFALFDVNMKPNMTGPGRPGREDQASLTAIAAEAIGWDYGRLLKEILASARSLHVLRNTRLT